MIDQMLKNYHKLIKDAQQELISEFMRTLRDLHDYTLTGLLDGEKVVFIRFQIEEALKIYEEKLE